MAWFGFALLGTLTMTGVQYASKFLAESRVRQPFALMAFMACANGLWGVLLWLLSGMVVLPVEEAGLLLLAGTAPAFGGYFYFQALMRAETSTLLVASQTAAIFILILSVVFLGEVLSAAQLLGFALILMGVIAVTLQPGSGHTGSRRTSWTVLGQVVIANLIYAASFVLSAGLIGRLVVDFRTLSMVTAYTSVGFWCGAMILVLLIPPVRRAFVEQIRALNRGTAAAFGVMEAAFVGRQFLVYTALLLGPASLVGVVGSLDVIFAVGFGWALTRWRPEVFKEDIRRRSLLRKLIWAGVAFVGVILLG